MFFFVFLRSRGIGRNLVFKVFIIKRNGEFMEEVVGFIFFWFIFVIFGKKK